MIACTANVMRYFLKIPVRAFSESCHLFSVSFSKLRRTQTMCAKQHSIPPWTLTCERSVHVPGQHARQEKEVSDELTVIPPTDGIANPGTVVIELRDASVRDGAVFRAQRLANLPEKTIYHDVGQRIYICWYTQIRLARQVLQILSMDSPSVSAMWTIALKK